MGSEAEETLGSERTGLYSQVSTPYSWMADDGPAMVGDSDAVPLWIHCGGLDLSDSTGETGRVGGEVGSEQEVRIQVRKEGGWRHEVES